MSNSRRNGANKSVCCDVTTLMLPMRPRRESSRRTGASFIASGRVPKIVKTDFMNFGVLPMNPTTGPTAIGQELARSNLSVGVCLLYSGAS